MTKKTEFEELYSEIIHTDHYNKTLVKFMYLNDEGLSVFRPDEILKYEDKMFTIDNGDRNNNMIEIPTYRIYVVLYNQQVILNRIRGYNGKIDLQSVLDEYLEENKDDDFKVNTVIKYLHMDNLYHYPRSGKLDKIEVTEKIDGANMRWIHKSSNEIWFGSRNNFPIAKVRTTYENGVEYLSDTGATLGDRREINVEKTFRPFIEFICNMSMGNTLPHDYKNLLFFGEAVGNHKIKYKRGDDNKVVGFAVFDLKERKWRSDWESLHWMMKIKAVPVYDMKDRTPFEIAEYILENQKELISLYDSESRIEGVVMADYENQIFYKCKTDEFITTKQPKEKLQVLDFEFFVEKYATEQRIEKIINKMKNEDLGYNPKNPIPSLVGHVMKDVIEEEMPSLLKIIKKQLQPLIIKAITSKRDILAKALELKK